MLDLTPDEVLTTTRAVRRRLDTSRSVDRALVEKCLEIALQAPTAMAIRTMTMVAALRPRMALRFFMGRNQNGWLGNRITSYNVCYTKLLRPASGD